MTRGCHRCPHRPAPGTPYEKTSCSACDGFSDSRAQGHGRGHSLDQLAPILADHRPNPAQRAQARLDGTGEEPESTDLLHVRAVIYEDWDSGAFSVPPSAALRDFARRWLALSDFAREVVRGRLAGRKLSEVCGTRTFQAAHESLRCSFRRCPELMAIPSLSLKARRAEENVT